MHRAHAIYAAAPKQQEETELIQRYAPLIERLARRMAAKSGIPSLQDDLWSAGALGVVDAARRFEPGRGVKFETFAEHRVRGAMLDEMRRLDHLPRRLRERSEAVAKARRELATALGRPASDLEVADAMQMTEAELIDVEGAAAPPSQLDPEQELRSDAPPVEEQLDLARQTKLLAEHVEKLPERLRTILGLHYQEGCTYREIAQLLNISEPRVCQLHAQALEKLRDAVSGAIDHAA
jgi:RNA polymerase sigma factor FliA